VSSVVHFLAAEDPRKLACGSSGTNGTSDLAKVTCKTCLRSITSAARRAEREVRRKANAPPQRTTISRAFHSKVAGVSHSNDDGGSRQLIISRCRVGELLTLTRDPTNPYDANAIRVYRGNGEQLGYLDRHVAAQLAPDMDSGINIPCCISDLTGGGEYTRGVNIYLGGWTAPAEPHRNTLPRDERPVQLTALLIVLLLLAGAIAVAIHSGYH
jgi:HIRAN domain